MSRMNLSTAIQSKKNLKHLILEDLTWLMVWENSSNQILQIPKHLLLEVFHIRDFTVCTARTEINFNI